MRKNWKWFLGMAGLVIATVFSRQAEAQTSSIDLKSAIQIAMANNYGLKSDSMNIAMTDFSNKVTRADFLPQVNFSGKTEYNPALAMSMLPGSVAGQPSKDLVPVQFGTRYSMGVGVEVTQNILRKDIRIKMSAAGLNNAIAQSKYNLSKEDLIYQVASSFYSLQTNAKLIQITDRDYRNMLSITTIAKAQFEAGTIKRIDYESLQINTANKESQLSQLKSDYESSLSYFKYLLGLPANASIKITENINSINESGDFAEDQIQKREDVRLSHQMIESKQTDIKSIRAEGLPSLSSYFRFNYQSQFNDIGNAMNNDYRYKSATVGLSAKLPLFDGNRRRNRINIAETELQQLRFNSLMQEDLARTELASKRQTLISNKSQYGITEKNLALAEKVFNSRVELYKEGVSSLIELLDAESELTNSKNLHIQAQLNVQTSLLDMHKAKGTLLTDYLQSL